jgi:two-component system phosphate regulon sensor histidine kinase PhoR
MTRKRFSNTQMIRDENKRMHAQVENVLRISKLEKKELDIEKESSNVEEVLLTQSSMLT